MLKARESFGPDYGRLIQVMRREVGYGGHIAKALAAVGEPSFFWTACRSVVRRLK